MYLDPYYQLLPSDKKIKTQIHESYYNYCRELFINQMKESADFCSLTADLWTSRSNAGFLGVTCSWLDQNFNLHEVTLAIQEIKYPHTGIQIFTKLEY